MRSVQPSSLCNAAVCGRWAYSSATIPFESSLEGTSSSEFDPDQFSDVGTLLHAIVEMWISKCETDGKFEYRRAVELFSDRDSGWKEELEEKTEKTLTNPLAVMDIIKRHREGFLCVKEAIDNAIRSFGDIQEIHCEIGLPLPTADEERPYLELSEHDIKMRGVCDALFIHEKGLMFYDWKTSVPQYAKVKYQAQVLIYMELAFQDDTFQEKFSSHMHVPWIGCIIGMSDSTESQYFKRDSDRFQGLVSAFKEPSESSGDHCRWFCPALNDADNPCRDYSVTGQAKMLRNENFWFGYEKPGTGAFEFTPRSTVNMDEIEVTLKTDDGKWLNLKFDPELSGTIAKNQKVRLIGYLRRRNENEGMMNVESVVFLE